MTAQSPSVQQQNTAQVEVIEYFTAYFFAKEHIKPFKLDRETLDILSEFIESLIISLKQGYDESKPIIVSRNEKNPDLDGHIIDGRHRSIALQAMKNRAIKNKEMVPPWPLVKGEYVKDLAHLKARQAFYDLRNQSKNLIFASTRAEKNIMEILAENRQETDTLDKALGFLYARGLMATELIKKIYKRFQQAEKKRQEKLEALQRLMNTTDESSKEAEAEKAAQENFNSKMKELREPVKVFRGRIHPGLGVNDTLALIKCPCCSNEYYGICSNNTIAAVYADDRPSQSQVTVPAETPTVVGKKQRPHLTCGKCGVSFGNPLDLDAHERSAHAAISTAMKS